MNDNWYSEDSATFGDRLAAARDHAGMTQKELARRLGVRSSTLKHWEEDLNEPRANKLQMVAGLLGVSLSWLLTGEGEGVSPPDAGSEVPADVTAAIAELRSVRAEARALADRLGVLEKRLRSAVSASHDG